MVVMAAVEPGTKTETEPSSTPDERTISCTPCVRSITSPSPSVEKRSSPVWTPTPLEARAARERLARVLLQQDLESLHPVRRHRVAVVLLGAGARAHRLVRSAAAVDKL